MNFSKSLIMASALAITGTGTCLAAADSTKVIEQPKVTVTNGQFTPEILESLGKVSNVVVSPDKKKILYCVAFESIEMDKGNNEIWCMNVDGSNPVQLTKSANSESNAVWFDGGKKIAFLYKEGKVNQMFVMNADGSDRKCVSTVEKGIDAFKISPDEKHVVFVSSVKFGETTQDVYPDLKKASGRIITDLMYKHWDEWVTEIPQPFVADFDGTVVSNPFNILGTEPYESPLKPFGGIEQITWSPDSKTIVYTCRKKTGMAYSLSTNSDLYQYDIATKTTKNLTEGMMGYDTNPAFSPKGDYMAWLSMEHDGYESDKNRIFLLDTKTGVKTDLTANWDYSVDNIAWNPDGKSIFFNAYYQGTEPLFKISIANKKVDILANDICDYTNAVPIDSKTVLSLRHSMQVPNEIYVVSGKDVKQLSHVNDALIAELKPIKVEKRMVPTTDGKQMTTWVILPPDFDPAKKYPAILYCQGGPQQAVSQFWSFRWNFRLMASNGYVIIAPNRRGLPGFGTEWNAQISGDYGGQNMKDYLSAVDYMKKEPYIDGEHIGATGASYGGFSVYWLAGNHNHRFAALFAHAGIFNTEAQYLETEEMWFANWDLGGPFWDKNNAIAQRSFENSPHKFVQNWDAPIMISVGEKDYRILASQGMMAFNAAKLRGIPTKLLVYPNENHWILRPQNAIMWQREFYSWFDKWLKPSQAK